MDKDVSNKIEEILLRCEEVGYPTEPMALRTLLHEANKPYADRVSKALTKLDNYGTFKAKEVRETPQEINQKQQEVKLIGAIINALKGFKVRL